MYYIVIIVFTLSSELDYNPYAFFFFFNNYFVVFHEFIICQRIVCICVISNCSYHVFPFFLFLCRLK